MRLLVLCMHLLIQTHTHMHAQRAEIKRRAAKPTKAHKTDRGVIEVQSVHQRLYALSVKNRLNGSEGEICHVFAR